MPYYCYSSEESDVVEKYFPMGDAPKSIRVKGKTLKRDFRAEHMPRPAGTGWPMVCYASGVNAEQAGELRDFLGKNGCPTEVTNGGDPIYTSASHRKKALKLRGMYDRSSYC